MGERLQDRHTARRAGGQTTIGIRRDEQTARGIDGHARWTDIQLGRQTDWQKEGQRDRWDD